MKELSIFVDESGDFGKVDNKSPYYLVTFIFHNQKNSLKESLNELENSLSQHGFSNALLHAGPNIRNEDSFRCYSLDERRFLFYRMLPFYRHAPISHSTVIVNKKEITDIFQLNTKISNKISVYIKDHLPFFQSFDKIIVYYDNGQQELNQIINTILSANMINVEFRKATPEKYRLLQLADFICTLELLNLKYKEKRLSKSEELFFYKPQELKKTFLKILDVKRLK